jgi:hypothetical protein
MAGTWGQRLGNPDARAVDAAVKTEWRAEQEAATADALDGFRHERTLRDVALETVHRGDRLSVTLPNAHFLGTVEAVGDDLLSLRAVSGRVDLHLHPALPLMLQVGERARDGGTRETLGDGDFRGALLAREAAGEVTLGCVLLSEPIDGKLVVGKDHVCVVRRGGGETFIPLSSVSYVMPRRD